MTECAIDGCDSAVRAKGMCSSHWNKVRRYGDPFYVPRNRRPKGSCEVDGCESPAEVRQWCQAHHARWRRHGDPLGGMLYATNEICDVDGCDRASECAGQCGMHYQRIAKHGTPDAQPRPDTRRNDSGYHAAHWRVKSEKGPARWHACVDCCGPAEEWSYVGGAPDERTQVLEGGYAVAYSLDIANYVARCKKCHRRHDRAARAARQAEATISTRYAKATR